VIFVAACTAEDANTPPDFSAAGYEAFVADQFNFDDPEATEARFFALAEQASTPEARAEFLTQAARAQGVQDRLEEAQATLERSGAAQSADTRLSARYALERGRLLRRSGDVDAAVAAFTEAYTIATEDRHDALAADAAHMMAITAPAEEAPQWMERGLVVALGSENPTARAWVGTISYNRGMALSERGDHGGAALHYARALAARERLDDAELIEATELALARELLALGSTAQGRAILTRLQRDARAAGRDSSEIDGALAAAGE
jgi:tetratricopeptide (TPR) repeat protein